MNNRTCKVWSTWNETEEEAKTIKPPRILSPHPDYDEHFYTSIAKEKAEEMINNGDAVPFEVDVSVKTFEGKIMIYTFQVELQPELYLSSKKEQK